MNDQSFTDTHRDKFLQYQEELFENPAPRLPICLVLDVSGSMRGTPIAMLQDGIKQFFAAIRKDEVTRSCVEIAIVTFGGSVEIDLDFRSIDDLIVPELEAAGMTPMGEAIMTALDLLEARLAEYHKIGVNYYRPWMVLMSDGCPTDRIFTAAERIAILSEKCELTVFPIAIGNADIAALQHLGYGRTPLHFKGPRFAEFFQWLIRSISHVARTTPGKRIFQNCKSGRTL